MARQIFKQVDLNKLARPQVIDSPSMEWEREERRRQEEQQEHEEVAVGPSIEEVEREIANLRVEFDKEIEGRRSEVMDEAERVRKDAENWAFSKVKEAAEEAESIMNKARQDAEKSVNEAQSRASDITREAERRAVSYEKAAFSKGYDEGRDQGFELGQEEVNRLIDRIKRVIQSTIQKRSEVLQEAEAQVIDIVIAITRKVVKTISESHKEVVRRNIKDALAKLRERTEITIRVNTEDLHVLPKYKADFIDKLEEIEGVRILEDSSVDPGGAVIETDFGSIDARIAAQLSEIEQRIKEITPFREEV